MIKTVSRENTIHMHRRPQSRSTAGNAWAIATLHFDADRAPRGQDFDRNRAKRERLDRNDLSNSDAPISAF